MVKSSEHQPLSPQQISAQPSLPGAMQEAPKKGAPPGASPGASFRGLTSTSGQSAGACSTRPSKRILETPSTAKPCGPLGPPSFGAKSGTKSAQGCEDNSMHGKLKKTGPATPPARVPHSPPAAANRKSHHTIGWRVRASGRRATQAPKAATAPGPVCL